MAAIAFPAEKVVVDLEKPTAQPALEVPQDFDPAGQIAKQLLAAEEASYHSAADVALQGSYLQGQSLVRINDLGLFRAAGFTSFREYVEVRLELDESSAHILMSLARAYTKEQLERLGVSAARAGLRLLNATPEPDTVNDLFVMVLNFDDGTSVRFIDATIRQIDEFIRQVKRRGRKVVTYPEADFARISAIADSLKQAAADVALKMVVSMPELVPADAPPPPGGHKLKVDVTIKGAPMDELPALFESLAGAARRT